MKVKNGEIKVV